MNRKERRATIKKSKGDPELVMFAVHAPPMGTQMTVVKTNLQAFEAMNYGNDPAKLREMTLTQQILTWDKDIIRAIYYPDEVQSVKETPQFFTAALAESVNLWSQRLTAAQLPYFDRHGLHRLTITEVEPEHVEWYWTLNANNKMQLQTPTAWLWPLSHIDMRGSPKPNAIVHCGIAGDETTGLVM
jgi:hypothetical protein